MIQTGPTDLTSLGSAGLLIYLVIKEALAFAKGKKNGGETPLPAAWELKFNQIVKEQNEAVLEYQKEITRTLDKILNDKLDKVLRNQIDTNFTISQLLLAKGIMPQKQKED